MNQKILTGLMITVIVLVSIHLSIVLNERSQHESDIWDKDSPGIGEWTGTPEGMIRENKSIDINSYDDLKHVLEEVSIEMMEEEIFLELKDYYLLYTYDDVNIIRLSPNQMDGFGSGKGTWHDGYSLHEHKKDGTRIWEEFSKNGTLLKSIKIYDEPEKEILILLK